MSAYERLLAPGSTELPECRCGKEMQLTRIEELPDRTDAQIRIYNCSACHHETSGPMTYRLRVISVSSSSWQAAPL